jgi:peroxiredoxin
MMVDDPNAASFRLAQRAYVVIDRQGIIRHQQIMEDPDDALDAQEIFTIVEKIVAETQ